MSERSKAHKSSHMNVSVRGATMEAPTSSDSDEPPATLLATLHELRCARQISVNDVAFDSVDEWKLVKEEGDWRTVCALCTTGKRRCWKAIPPEPGRTRWRVHNLTSHVEGDAVHARVLNEVSVRCVTADPCGHAHSIDS